MFRSFLLCLVAAVLATSTQAFQINTGLTSARTTSTTGFAPLEAPVAVSSTALNLKVKVDPDAVKNDRTNPAVFKNALYVGSVAFAVLLPLIFVVAGNFK
mmetsp:Transcript_29654/g.81525  ORF Transcript_29654/g.81525 Transcript_29654/m.81525 type:complete len:100 (+) Transcript_29654:150-449(+)